MTLLFSDTHYLRTADAYLRALERHRRAGLDLAVPSVASLFISRWDSAADPLLPPALHEPGLAMAQKTYASHLQLPRPALAAARRRQAPVRSGFCGPPPRPRTQTCPTPTMIIVFVIMPGVRS